jgi:hypothetical protein
MARLEPEGPRPIVTRTFKVRVYAEPAATLDAASRQMIADQIIGLEDTIAYAVHDELRRRGMIGAELVYVAAEEAQR